MPKAPSRKKLPIAPIGGVLFTAIMFIIFSMMVISEGNRERTVVSPITNTENSETVNNQQQITLLQQELSQARLSEAKLQICSSQLDTISKELDGYSGLLSVTDLDERFLGELKIKYSSPDLLKIPTSTQILVHRASPSGKQTLVIYGFKTDKGSEAHGFYARTNNRITSEWLWSNDQIKNVLWKNEQFITYDSFNPDTSTTTHITFDTHNPPDFFQGF